jgi:tRNA threonylcarbamoyladenosine biosynthesis protein TsaB
MTDQAGARILAIDTATRSSVVAIGRSSEAVEATDVREARHRHGRVLLEQIDEALLTVGISLDDIDAIAVGIGPGSFTGMRVGLATAKTIAHVRRLPLVGVPSSTALRSAVVQAHAAQASVAIVLPAGAHDHYLALPDEDVRLVTPDELVSMLDGRTALSVDTATDVLGHEAAAAGAIALDGLAAALLGLAAERFAADEGDDIEGLVPAYVVLPRGVRHAAEDLAWSPDLQ